MKQAFAAALCLTPLLGAMPQVEIVEEVQEPQVTIDSIIKDYNKSRADWMKAYRSATPAKRREMRPTLPRPDSVRRRMWKLIRKAPAEAANGNGLCWIAQNGARGKELSRALTMLEKHHIGHAMIGNVCSTLGYQVSIEAENFLRKVAKSATEKKTKGLAVFAMAQMLKRRADVAHRVAGDDKAKKAYTNAYGEEVVAMIAETGASKFEKRAEKHFETCTTEFSNLKFRRGTIGKSAKAALFELRNLAIGKVAPDIDGEDIDGVSFKLSDYRGKVVLLDFWGDW